MIRKGLLLSLCPLVAIAALGAWGFTSVDPGARFPVHWGIDGAPDRFGSRFEAFLGVPALALALTALFAAAPLLDPRGTNLRHSSQAYLTGWIGALCLLAVVQAGLTLTALEIWPEGAASPFQRMALGASAVLIAAVGNVLGKSRPNWLVGIRTPWTLSSDLAWERTHRMVGRLFVLVGGVGLVAALIAPLGLATLALAIGALASAGWAIVNSYLVWRTDPDKRTGPQVLET